MCAAPWDDIVLPVRKEAQRPQNSWCAAERPCRTSRCRALSEKSSTLRRDFPCCPVQSVFPKGAAETILFSPINAVPPTKNASPLSPQPIKSRVASPKDRASPAIASCTVMTTAPIAVAPITNAAATPTVANATPAIDAATTPTIAKAPTAKNPNMAFPTS